MGRSLWVLLGAGFGALLLPIAAAAQSEPPSFSISGGAGVAFPFHGDYSFNAFEWHVSMRTSVAKYFLVEGMFDEWRHTTNSATRDVTFRNGSGVVLGHADEVLIEDAERTSVLGLNFFVTGAVGRLRISGGGGPSLMTFRSNYSTSYRGCTATMTSLCNEHTNTNSESALGMQGVADLDVALTSNVSAFGRALVAGPFMDPGSGHFGMVGGVRLSLR